MRFHSSGYDRNMITPGRRRAESRRLRRVGRFVATRLAAVFALGLIVYVALGDVGSLFRDVARSSMAPTPSESPDTAGPGWPHRRGPNYDGTSSETDLADSWPAEGPPLLWSQPCGRGFSGVTVVDAFYALLSFTLFFWAVGAVLLWKAAAM